MERGENKRRGVIFKHGEDTIETKGENRSLEMEKNPKEDIYIYRERERQKGYYTFYKTPELEPHHQNTHNSI